MALRVKMRECERIGIGRRPVSATMGMQDFLDLEWWSVKHYVRRQLAKCVNECKNQASNAKKLVGSLRGHEGKKRPSLYQMQGISEYDDDDLDGWDTDFDDDEEDEVSNASAEQAGLVEGSQVALVSYEDKSRDENFVKESKDVQNLECLASEKTDVPVQHFTDSLPSTALDELNTNTIPSDAVQNGHTAKGCSDANGNEVIQEEVPRLQELNQETTLQSRPVPRPPDKPGLPKPPNVKPLVSAYPNLILPRGFLPYRRPQDHPPPPPPPSAISSVQYKLTSSFPGDELHEDYEIPISALSQHPQFQSLATRHVPSPSPSFSTTSSLSSAGMDSTQETYEVIESLEENYEAVDDIAWSGSSSSLASSASDRPILPPRNLGVHASPPPPLPEKPKKLREVQPAPVTISKGNKSEPVSTVERPKLPRGKDVSQSKRNSEDPLSQGSGPYATLSGSGLLSSVLSGFSSLTERKKATGISNYTSRGDTYSGTISNYSGSSNSDTVSMSTASTGSQSSRASTPDRCDPYSSSSNRKVSPPDLGVQPVDDASGLASRPLPPVPDRMDDLSMKQDLQQYSWFHDVERQGAELLLLQQGEDGTYVVRISRRAGQDSPFTLSVLLENKVYHLNIRRRPDGLYALGKEKPREKTFAAVAELVKFHQTEPILLTTRGSPAGKVLLSSTPEK